MIEPLRSAKPTRASKKAIDRALLLGTDNGLTFSKHGEKTKVEPVPLWEVTVVESRLRSGFIREPFVGVNS